MATGMPTSVNLTWSEPFFAGNLTSYSIRCISLDGSSDQIVNTVGLGSNVTVDNLVPETVYTCHVISVAGSVQGGSASAVSATLTPGTYV